MVEEARLQQSLDTSVKRPSVVLVTQGFQGGGVTTVSRWLTRELASSGAYDVVVYVLATSSKDPNSRRIVRPGTWFRRSLRGTAQGWAEHWGANLVEVEAMRYRPRKELTRALDTHDLVQVVAGSPALGKACLKSRRPVVLQMATTAEWERRSRIPTFSRRTRWWHRIMTMLTTRAEKRAITRADSVMVENDDMRTHVEGLGQRSVRVAPPGVDVRRLHPPSSWASSGYLLSLCRLDEPRKGLDRLVRAYSQLHAKAPKAPHLVLAGQGDLSSTVRALIAEQGLEEWIDVRHDVPAKDLPGLFQSASVYWQSSHEEGLGISVLEAMACGLPVVATETAGTRQTIVHGVTGWLIPQDDEEALVEMFVEKTHGLLTSDGSSFGAAGRKRAVEVFAADITVSPFLDVYGQLLSGPREIAEER